MTPMLAAVGGYLLLQFAIGIAVSRRIRTEDDYLVAGRRLGPWLVSASIFATWFGAETIVGSSAAAYTDGISLASAEPFGYGLCIIVMGLVFAIPLWRRRLTTMADLFRQRYSPTAERLAALVLIPSSILWAAAQMRAFGQVIVVSGAQIGLETGLAIAAAVVVLYTVAGGMLADAMTDLVQAGVLVVSLLILGAAVVAEAGGFAAAGAILTEGGRIHLMPHADTPWPVLLEEWAIPICGSVVATELVSRVIAARSGGVARGAALGAGAMYLAVGTIPLVLGALAVPLLGTAPADAEQVIPMLAQQALPGWLYIVFAGGLVSAILSTVDSTLLVAAGLGAHNLILPQLRAPTERTKIRVTRALVALGGLVAWSQAHSAEGVFALVESASAFGSAGVLVTVCFALFTRWGGPRAAIATLIGGVAVYLVAVASHAATPYLYSLAASLLLYTGVAAFERRPPVPVTPP